TYIGELPPGAERAAEVPVTIAAPHGPGSRLSVRAIAEGPGTRAEQECEITAAEPGWTIWMVCHFHYDPVWWNTQGGFTEAGLAADPSVAWALDAFGHDPGYPGLMAAAGMTGSAWARGPYHQWGPWRTVGDNSRMQFPSEFEWISPDGRGLLTSYMANHYGAGWVIHQ